MSNKTEEALDLPHGNCIMGDECGNLSALRDHYQAPKHADDCEGNYILDSRNGIG